MSASGHHRRILALRQMAKTYSIKSKDACGWAAYHGLISEKALIYKQMADIYWSAANFLEKW